MTERKFTRGLNKPGMAAQLRETVSQVVRESTVLVRKSYKFSSFVLSFCIVRYVTRNIYRLLACNIPKID